MNIENHILIFKLNSRLKFNMIRYMKKKEGIFMQYDTLLFDIDNTLLDFEADESQALNRLFDFVGIELTDELHQKYSNYNKSLWQKLERNEITRDELLATRFNVFFKENFNRDVTDLNLNERYINYLSDGHDLMPHAAELLQLLKQNPAIRLEVATNGVPQTQYKRLKEAEIMNYFDQIFVSQDIGINKPNIGFYNYIENHLENFNTHRTLMIGDSLTSDIQGGNNANIDTVWFNPQHLDNSSSAQPTYEIDDLLQIKKLI